MFYPVSYSASRIIQNPLVAIDQDWGLTIIQDWIERPKPIPIVGQQHKQVSCAAFWLIRKYWRKKNCNKLYSTVHCTLSMLPYYLGKSQISNMSQSKKPIQKTQFLKLPHHIKRNIFLSNGWVDMVACHKFYFQLRYRLLAHFSTVDHYAAPSSNGLRTEGAMCTK